MLIAMSNPKMGDVILRSLDGSFELVDALTGQRLFHNILSLPAAVEIARQLGAAQIWQQNVDNRGRALGEPFRLLRPPSDAQA